MNHKMIRIGSMLLLVSSVVILCQPMELASARNSLALCWVQNAEPADVCKGHLNELLSFIDGTPSIAFATARYAGLAHQYLMVDELIGDFQPNQLPPIEARLLFSTSLDLGDIDQAIILANRAQVTTEQLLEFAVSSYNQEDFTTARKWANAVISRNDNYNLHWILRRDLGILIWQLDRDRSRSLNFLNQVHDEEPTALIPMLFLALIDIDNHSQRSLELFDQATHLNPDASAILKDILVNSIKLQSPEAQSYTLDLRRRIIKLLESYLEKHPWSARVQDSLNTIESVGGR